MTNDLATTIAQAVSAALAQQAGPVPPNERRSLERELDEKLGASIVTVQWMREKNLSHFGPVTMTGVGRREGVNDRGEAFTVDLLFVRGRETEMAIRLGWENYGWLTAHFGPLSTLRYKNQQLVVWLDPTVSFGREVTGGVRLCLPGEQPWNRTRPLPPTVDDPRTLPPAGNSGVAPAQERRPFSTDLDDDIPF